MDQYYEYGGEDEYDDDYELEDEIAYLDEEIAELEEELALWGRMRG